MSENRRTGRPDEFDLFRQVSVLTSRVVQVLEKQLVRDYQISLPELLVLVELRGGHQRGMRIQDLADAVGLDQSSMSRMVTRLEKKALTSRVSCDYDRRGVYCELTPLGRERSEQAEAVCRRELGAVFDAAAFDDRTAALIARLRYNAPATKES
ncbi:MarR family transcriptional regulator [Kitasatospora sp. MAA4]|uniref:MarR family transcriptional regulator n=1 Tax=Kitasatospora sp. MAA4 TaxID=3035093 RepID=UPI002476DC35|nr:MarR family transcriptional regulator [Kitasatospora sp. MAA4]